MMRPRASGSATSPGPRGKPARGPAPARPDQAAAAVRLSTRVPRAPIGHARRSLLRSPKLAAAPFPVRVSRPSQPVAPARAAGRARDFKSP